MRMCGTHSAYAGGCRCDACKDAERIYNFRARHPDAVIEAPTDTLQARPDWFDDAICRGKSGLFFASGYERAEARERREAAAAALCARCPVRLPCRDAGRAGHEYGIWGGENEVARVRTGHGPQLLDRRELQRAAHEARQIEEASG